MAYYIIGLDTDLNDNAKRKHFAHIKQKNLICLWL